MRIFAVVLRCHACWHAFTAIVNLPIGRLDASDRTFIEDDAQEHIGLGVTVEFISRPADLLPNRQPVT